MYSTNIKRKVTKIAIKNYSDKNSKQGVKTFSLQYSDFPDGPWRDALQNQNLPQSSEWTTFTNFEADAQFWRMLFTENWGQASPGYCRYILHGVEFYGY